MALRIALNIESFLVFFPNTRQCKLKKSNILNIRFCLKLHHENQIILFHTHGFRKDQCLRKRDCRYRLLGTENIFFYLKSFLLADFRFSFNPKILKGIASPSSSYDPLRLALAWKLGHPHRRSAKLGTLERSVTTASNTPRSRKWHKRRVWWGRGRGVLWNPPSQQTAAQLCGAWSRHVGVKDSTFCHETVSANTKKVIHTVILPKR